MSLNKNTVGIILSAGKVHESLYSIFGEINTGMVPINGKPAILHILKKYNDINIDNLFISVGYDKKKLIELINASYGKIMNINFIEVDYHKKPGTSLLKALKKISKKHINSSVLITLADTVVSYDYNKLLSDENKVLISNDFEVSNFWCTIKEDTENNIISFSEKEAENNYKWALIGVYYLKNIKILNNLKVKNYNISDLLKIYLKQTKNIKTVKIDNWIDTGHLNKYYQAKKNILTTRYFNSFEYNDILGVIKKYSSDKNKLRNEIIWYENIPNKLKILTPKIIDYDIDGDVFLEMEYYGYPSLAELWLYGKLSFNIWSNIFKRLLKLINYFNDFKGKVVQNDYHQMYYIKTKKRIKKLRDINPNMSKLLDYKYIYINKKRYKGLPFFWDKIKKNIDNLYDENDNCILHGDLNFSNVLYDLNNGIIRLIDPRGEWGNNLLYGDIKYDIAKLRHSISGKYDFIINDLFRLSINKNQIDIKFDFTNKTHHNLLKEFDSLIDNYYDIKKIKFIEALLFISMLPLHNDNIERQIAMFTTGLMNLNEVFSE